MTLKISVNLNRVTLPLQSDFNKVIEYFQKHNLNIIFNFKNVSEIDYKSTWNDVNKRWFLMGTEKLITKDPTSDIDMFVFNQSEWATPQGSPFPLREDTPTDCTYLATGKPYICVGVYESGDWIQFAHEIMHALAKKYMTSDVMDTYILNNTPDHPLSNFSQQWKILEKYISRWQYFKAGEFTNASRTHTIAELKPEFVDLLDKMRGECGFAWKITSGYRTVAENNQLLDSVSDSAHTSALAIDVSCTESTKRLKIIDVAIKNGITRLGIAKTFIHLDTSKTLPSGVAWLY